MTRKGKSCTVRWGFYYTCNYTQLLHTGILLTNAILILALFGAMAGGTPVQNSNETKSHSTDVSDGQELFKRDLQMPEKKIRRYYSITDFEKAAILSRSRQLVFFVQKGYSLPDKDGWFNNSDPYVEFIVFRHDGTHVRKTSSAKKSTQWPEWGESIYFISDTWRRFKIRVWDEDDGNDDPLSDQQTVTITSGIHFNRHHDCYSGYIVYDYICIE